MNENTTVNVMIDPSLIVANRVINKTFSLIRQFSQTGDFKFYLPKTFLTLVNEDFIFPESPTFKFFQQNAFPTETQTIKRLIKEHSNIITIFDFHAEHREKYGRFFESLIEETRYWRGYIDEHTLNILFEEWVFLQEYSMIVSRIKRTFNKFIDSGAVCLQFGRRTFEIVVRKTLKKKDDEFITKVDKLRAFGKWVAVGGPTILSFFNPVVSAFGSLISGYFLLFDPDATADNKRICDSLSLAQISTIVGTSHIPRTLYFR